MMKENSALALRKKAWDRVILDEAHYIRNRNIYHKKIRTVTARYRWALTGNTLSSIIPYHPVSSRLITSHPDMHLIIAYHPDIIAYHPGLIAYHPSIITYHPSIIPYHPSIITYHPGIIAY